MSFTDSEARVLAMLLAGEHPALRVLRVQAGVATVARREVRNGGRLLEFALPDEVARLTARSLFIHDLHLERAGRPAVDGTPTLMVVDGALWVLSLPDWPEFDVTPAPDAPPPWTAGYLVPDGPTENGWQRWRPAPVRDFAWFDAALAEAGDSAAAG